MLLRSNHTVASVAHALIPVNYRYLIRVSVRLFHTRCLPMRNHTDYLKESIGMGYLEGTEI